MFAPRLRYVMSDDQIKNLEFNEPDTINIQLSDDEKKINIEPIKLSDQQFFNIELSLRSRVTRIVGKSMQMIEMIGLPPKQEKAVKDNLKNMIWNEISDWIDNQAEISDLTPDYKDYDVSVDIKEEYEHGEDCDCEEA